MASEIRLLMGGPQGAGLETAAQVLSTAYAVHGLKVYSYREYYSNIKGRHTYILIRARPDRTPYAPREGPSIISAIDAESVFHHYSEAVEGTIIIYNEADAKRRLNGIISMEPTTRRRISAALEAEGCEKTVIGALKCAEKRGASLLGLNYALLLRELSKKTGIPPHRARRFQNTIPMAAAAYLTGLSIAGLERGFERRFRGKQEVIEGNIELARIVYETLSRMGREPGKLPPARKEGKYLVVSGNDVVAIGKVVAGLRVQTYYPITPAADESFVLERYEALRTGGESLGSILVFQTEDEIAAISAAIGAALTGARAATSTSGPGFDLMIEALGWAGINEVPVVVTYYQRGGPSTGLPTRGGQEDLFNALFSGHGLFPKIVIASGDHEEAFDDAVRAFNLAEKYQLPVIHLLDKFLANTIVTITPPDPAKYKIDRGLISEGGPSYKRFDKRDGPITPRAFIGTPNTVVWYTGDEHNPEGHICEDPENRELMHDMRMRKLEIADREIPDEERYSIYGEPSDILLIGWGSVKGAALEAIEELSRQGVSAGYLHIRMMEPFPSRAVSRILGEAGDKAVLVEHSVRPLLGRLIAMNTGVQVEKSILKWTGRPIYTGELVRSALRIARGESSREVLRYGA